jgi:broad specificity phosphatase PhoE
MMPAGHTEVVLVRHGATAWSESGKHTGRTDVPLSDIGRHAAALVGQALEGRQFSLVLASPLSRALETCSIAGFGRQAQVRDDLREWDYGTYDGRTTEEIQATSPGWTVWRGPMPGGETVGGVGTRCDRVIAEIQSAAGDVLMFSHGHALRILGARWVGLPAVDGKRFALATAAISVLGFEHQQRVFSLWNSTAHLRP